mgnify:CR=1 FL=1
MEERVKRILRFIPSALAGFALIVIVSSAKANEQEAAAFISNLANQALQTLGDVSIPLEAREEKLRVLLQDGFAMKFIGRYVLGKYWKKMTAAQQEEYQKLFAEWTLRTYSSRLGGYKNQKFTVVKVIDNGKKDIFVKTRINQPGGGDPIDCDWRIRKVNGKYKIVDIGIAGISMLLTQKREFASLLNRNGINGLIEMLRVRNSKFTAMSS